MAGNETERSVGRSIFYELSRSLSESERNELLHSINSSLRIESVSGDGEQDTGNDEDEIKLRLGQEYRSAGLLERFIIWLRRLFTGKDPTTLMLEMKLGRLKKSIRQSGSNYTGFETRDLKPGIAEAVWPLYEDSLLLFTCFDKMFGKTGLFKDVMISLFRNHLRGQIKEPEEICGFDEMVEVYRLEGTDEAVRRRGNQLLEEELEKVIDNRLIGELETMVSPLLAADAVIRFPYKKVFSGFGLVGVEPMDIYEATGKIPTFKNATALPMLEPLEQLFRACYRIHNGESDFRIEPELARIVGEVCIKYDLTDDDIQDLTGRFEHLAESVKGFVKHVPVPELLRYFRKNPYYRIRIVQERMNLKAFFRTARKMIMREYVEEKLPEVRDEATERNIREIFAEGDVERLKNYRTYQSIAYDDLGLPMFAYQKSLALLYAFCNKNYRRDIQETVRILDRGLYALNRVERDRLLMHANAIEDVEEEIEKLDQSLSSEESDGKLFQKLRFSIGGDQGQLRMFRSLVQQKDREASSIVRRGRESVEGLNRILEDTLKIKNAAGLEALSQHYFVKGTPVSLRSIIERNIATLKRFTFIMQQIKRMEP